MAQALRSLGIEFDEIDVGSDPRLEALYGDDVPVLLGRDGVEICRHRLSAEDLGKLR